MIQITNVETFGWESAIRGMRNPMNSWDMSDSDLDYPNCESCPHLDKYCETMGRCCVVVGQNDLKLMKSLAKAGSDHGKFLRMINVTMDINAPLYWWKEFDTYKVGTVANSCSTMHKIHAKEFTMDDFSHEHLSEGEYGNIELLKSIIVCLNVARDWFIKTKDNDFWWQLIQLLPTSYNQLRTVQLNYQVLKNMYHSRRYHKLDEWRDFCAWIKTLPYSELITGEDI